MCESIQALMWSRKLFFCIGHTRLCLNAKPDPPYIQARPYLQSLAHHRTKFDTNIVGKGASNRCQRRSTDEIRNKTNYVSETLANGLELLEAARCYCTKKCEILSSS